MERPKGIGTDGKVKFDFGRMLSYRGRGSGRGMLTAEILAVEQDLFSRRLWWPGDPIGLKLRICPGCGLKFSGRNQAKTCSNKCRKRLERSLKAKAAQHVTVST
jgi:hypothetical protein